MGSRSHSVDIGQKIVDVSTNLIFIHGFVSSATNSVVPGGWSIAVEMTFYCVFPLILPLCEMCYAKFGRSALVVLPLLAIVFDIVFQLTIPAFFGEKIQNNNFWYFFFVNQLPVFLLGMSCYLWPWRPIKDKRKIVGTAAGFLFCSALSGLLLHSTHPMAATLLPSAAGMSFVFLLWIAQDIQIRVEWLEQVGQVSYSMYIIHFVFAWNFCGLILVAARSRGFSEISVYFPALAATILLSYMVGKLGKRAIEDPFIALGRRIIRNREKRVYLS